MFVDWIVVALYVGYHSKASRLIVAVAKAILGQSSQYWSLRRDRRAYLIIFWGRGRSNGLILQVAFMVSLHLFDTLDLHVLFVYSGVVLHLVDCTLLAHK